MKKLFFLICLFPLFNFNLFGQAPRAFSYQAIVRDSNNALLINRKFDFRISIILGQSDGPPVYVEKQNVKTNSYGLALFKIGAGSVLFGKFTDIQWSSGSYFIKLEVASSDNIYKTLGIASLLSVPYAFYSDKAGSLDSPSNYKVGEIAGPTGPTGPTGVTGNTGTTGAIGAKGATGATGAIGAKGATGATGAIGAKGATGAAGTNGAKGSTGATGATGIGFIGLTSSTSITLGIGNKTFTTNITSALSAYIAGNRVRLISKNSPFNYMEGLITIFSSTSMTVSIDNAVGTGTYALWNITLAGDKGITGLTGNAGINGVPGQTGPMGPQGLQGIVGLKGDTGSPGAAGAIGPTGIQGMQGLAGVTGATGPSGSGLPLSGTTGQTIRYNGSSWEASSLIYNNNTNIGIGTSTPVSLLQVNGMITTNALTILGGSDLAEPFDIKLENAVPGMVLVIDLENPGKLKLSEKAYDKRVAGIISGANHVKPGLIMNQDDVFIDGKYPVALSGRVYCYADATYGTILPGDLLTTSNVPGYAMKVTNYKKGQGSIIGKAMTGLSNGRGMVLVLVSLQ